jgi:hypothetical protein
MFGGSLEEIEEERVRLFTSALGAVELMGHVYIDESAKKPRAIQEIILNLDSSDYAFVFSVTDTIVYKELQKNEGSEYEGPLDEDLVFMANSLRKIREAKEMLDTRRMLLVMDLRDLYASQLISDRSSLHPNGRIVTAQECSLRSFDPATLLPFDMDWNKEFKRDGTISEYVVLTVRDSENTGFTLIFDFQTLEIEKSYFTDSDHPGKDGADVYEFVTFDERELSLLERLAKELS